MTINEMRVELVVFCHGRANLEDPCENCPVNNIDNVCDDFNWYNTPENLVEKAYRAMKGAQTMTITADEIRKAALELIGEIAQGEFESSGVVNASTCASLGYIYGVCKLAEMVAGDEEDV